MSDSNGIDFARMISCPLPEVRLRAHAAGPRQRGNAHRRLDPAALSCRLWQRPVPALWRTRRRSTLSSRVRRQGPDRVHDRFVRGPAALFPGRRHRQAGGPRHGQRPGGRRRDAALSFRPRSSSKKACRWPTCGGSSPRCEARAREAGVALVTGDTKVVDRGKGDQIFITTSGVGIVARRILSSHPQCAAGRPDPGFRHDRRPRHRHHVGARRDRVRDGAGKRFRLAEWSDARHARGMPNDSLHARSDTRRAVQCAERTGWRLKGRRQASRSRDSRAAGSSAACEMLGLDPFYVANEGKLIAVVPPHDADRLLGVMHGHPLGRNAAIIGEVVDDHRGMVILQSFIGGERLVTMLTGEQLPRIC